MNKTIGCPLRCVIFCHNRVARQPQLFELPLSDAGVRCVREVMAADRSEELFVLKRSPVPWRVPDDAGEASRPPRSRVICLPQKFRYLEDLWKLQVPVEERISRRRQLSDARHGNFCNQVRIVTGELNKDIVGGCWRALRFSRP